MGASQGGSADTPSKPLLVCQCSAWHAADSNRILQVAILSRALLATSPLVLMRALEMAFPLGMRSTFTMPPADSALSNSLHGFTAP